MTDTFSGVVTSDGKKRAFLTDDTMTKAGVPADSKAVGDKFKEVKDETDSLKGDLVNQEIEYYNRVLKQTKENVKSSGARTNGKYWAYYKEGVPSDAWGYFTFNVTNGEKYHVKTYTVSNARAVTIYDANNNLLVSYPSSNSSGETLDVTFDIPYNAVKMIVNEEVDVFSSIIEKVEENIFYKANIENAFIGKKLVTAGDSITYGAGINVDSETNVRMTYGAIVAIRNGMIFVNSGISGSTMGDVTNKGTTLNGFSKDRYKNVPTDTDILTIFFGWNDFAYGWKMKRDDYCMQNYSKYYDDCTSEQKATADNINWHERYMDNWYSVDNTTWCGAWNTVLKYYRITKKNDYKSMKIGVILPFSNDYSTYGEYIDRLEKICKYYGIEYVDASNSKEWFSTGYNRGLSETVSYQCLQQLYTVDGLHPNNLGYEMMANSYESFIKRL